MSDRFIVPAFPLTASGEFYENSDGEKRISLEFSGGMSLRDWFAGQALAGLLPAFQEMNCGQLARSAYDIADAMLKTRNP